MKRLLVHLDASPRSAERLEYALRLARRHESAVTVFYGVLPTLVGAPLALEAGGAVASALADIDRQQRERALALFERVAGGSGATWEECESEALIPALRDRGFVHDLLVLGQHDRRDDQVGPMPPDLVPVLLAESGRPALLLPSVGRFATLPAQVLLAWKPSRESARAATAALPWLRHARGIHVAWQPEERDAPSPLPGLTAWLRGHGIDCPVRAHSLDLADVGASLLSLCADTDAELLVMGCYGHSRIREWTLGGATRTVLQSQTLPVLMAH